MQVCKKKLWCLYRKTWKPATHVIPLLVETYLLLFLIIDIIILSLISLLFRCGYKNKIADFCIIALDGYSIPSSIYSYRQDSLYPMHFTLVKVDIFSILCRGRFQCLNKLKKYLYTVQVIYSLVLLSCPFECLQTLFIRAVIKHCNTEIYNIYRLLILYKFLTEVQLDFL